MTETCRSGQTSQSVRRGTNTQADRKNNLKKTIVIPCSLSLVVLSVAVYFARLTPKNESTTPFNFKESIHEFNRLKLLPLLKDIVTKDYFRYVKVNLERPCKLWCNDHQCNLPDCSVEALSNDECPISSFDTDNDNSVDETTNELATVDTELATDQIDHLIKLFECNDNDDDDSQYVDLLKNPERFTGYSGESAHRIWRAIYEENCFLRRDSRSPFWDDLCYEERIFYEAISGLHSSINIHLCAEYPINPLHTYAKSFQALSKPFGPNLAEYKRRFGNRPEYLDNLYKLFRLELKALKQCNSYLVERARWPDASTKQSVQRLLTVIEESNVPSSVDLSLKPSYISHELATHFHNITTTIIDCVGCSKCKLWGKVQLRGLGTAFKILSMNDLDKLFLNHQEIASLINAIARLSHSIDQIEKFEQLDYTPISKKQ